jgi:hypothetical protein
MNNGDHKNQVDAILKYFYALNPEGKLVGNDIFEWYENDRWLQILAWMICQEYRPVLFNSWLPSIYVNGWNLQRVSVFQKN